MSKSWVINFGVNKSHTTEFLKTKDGRGTFDKRKDVIQLWESIDFEEYKKLGYNYFRIAALHFGNDKFKICEKYEIIEEKFL